MKKNLMLIVIALVVGILPLFYNFGKNLEEPFSGSDGLAEKKITEISKDYKPWFSPVFEPPSSEIESLLFTLQAAMGAGVIGYVIGYLKGKKVNG
ncbi:MAG: energy-coupling factor ABC transporter substrate-binding protein [Calditerrivibrio sp.]|nr:energy-coupling factor ABC transporter substrate-binding protein [Calditerrivibrio sp.]MCA1932709.1 energy-coupling factor ABC transporter substrate-binding protein [Calditerrivibrio sp.]